MGSFLVRSHREVLSVDRARDQAFYDKYGQRIVQLDDLRVAIAGRYLQYRGEAENQGIPITVVLLEDGRRGRPRHSVRISMKYQGKRYAIAIPSLDKMEPSVRERLEASIQESGGYDETELLA